MPEPLVQNVKQDLKQPRLLKHFFADGQTPQILQTDHGKAFLNQVLYSPLKQYNVHHFLTSNEVNAAGIEHFNTTLRTKTRELFLQCTIFFATLMCYQSL